jgi:hypothetical protein
MSEILCPTCQTRISLSDALTSQWRRQFAADVSKRVEQAEARIIASTRASADAELGELREALEEKDARMAEFRRQEVELRKQERALQDRIGDVDVEVARRVAEAREAIGREVAASTMASADAELGELREALEE